jgi:hypothetical protein
MLASRMLFYKIKNRSISPQNVKSASCYVTFIPVRSNAIYEVVDLDKQSTLIHTSSQESIVKLDRQIVAMHICDLD